MTIHEQLTKPDNRSMEIQMQRAITAQKQEVENYIKINCECDLKLKIPPCYIGTIVICPHCGKKHKVVAKSEKLK